jgi:hypothetical protein
MLNVISAEPLPESFRIFISYAHKDGDCKPDSRWIRVKE